MSSTGEMPMTGDRPGRSTFTAAGGLVGFLVGLSCAIVLTRHLTLSEDPMGLIGIWALLLPMGASLGGLLGQMAARSVGSRETPGS
jgi:hypothetical protein